MRRSRFSEERIVAVLKEHETRAGLTPLCRRHEFSAQTFDRWKQKYGGLGRQAAKPALLRHGSGTGGMGVCPAGGGHVRQPSAKQVLRVGGRAPAGYYPNWRCCAMRRGLWHPFGGTTGDYPVGGGHGLASSRNHGLRRA